MAGTRPADNLPPGPAVDAVGRTVVDPSLNVIALTEAAVSRLDDLRNTEIRCLREVMELRAAYDEKLRDAESKRIDAIRAVDVGAVNRAAEVAATQALTLATQVASSADALRLQVATTASAFDAKLATALEPLNTNVSELQRALYETQGKGLQVSEGRQSSAAVWIVVAGVIGLLGLLLTLASVGVAIFLATR